MTQLEKIESEVKRLQSTNNLRIERNKRLRDLGSPKFTDFKYGKVWGAYQALGTVLGIIKKIKEEYHEQDNKY